MRPVISVIVPIYNVEKYLSKCLDSILSQTYEQLEIILVNDGSTDGCCLICNKYKQKDLRIKVIHKENGGLSSARNAGLDICNGKYISFIDSDDYIERYMYEKLIENIEENNSEIAIAGVKKVVEGEKVIIEKYENNVEIIDKQQAIYRYLLGEWIAAWDKLYRRELFDEIRFPIGKLNEDEAIMIKVFHKCNKITYNKNIMYYYLEREGSITKTKLNLKNNFDWIENTRINLDFIINNYPMLKKVAEKRYLGSIIWTLHSIEYCEGKSYIYERELLIKELKINLSKVIANKYISIIDKVSVMIMIININKYKKIRQAIKGIKYKME